MGAWAPNKNTTGTLNASFGFNALNYNDYGSGNTALEHNADAADTNYFNSMALRAYAIVNASNKVRIGGPTITVIEGAVPFSTPSDRRLKQNLSPSLQCPS